jgi:N-acetylglutamate synthase-like GNAT family acetyltransferase
MRIRTARKDDHAAVRKLAESLFLDYPGMELDDFWVAEDGGRIVGVCGLKKHPDCRELRALGVEPGARRSGTGAGLVSALLAAVPGDIYLATVIPGFFEKAGFIRTADIPKSMVKNPAWCEGCDRTLCTVMVSRGR